jgi:hypothetical protein
MLLALCVIALVAAQLPPLVPPTFPVGVAVTFVAMSVVAMSSNDIHTTMLVYELMATFDITLLPWTNFATFLTGIALSMTTKWGLFRYYWSPVSR